MSKRFPSGPSRNTAVTLQCAHCGKDFHPKFSRETTSKWCSVSCMAAGRTRTPEQFQLHFESLIDKTGECWLWRGTLSSEGYGSIVRKGKPRRAHRISYELFNGPVSAKDLVCHKCDNRRCVNPDHLFLGSNRDNMADMAKKDRHKFGIVTGGYRRRKLLPAQVRAIRNDPRPQRVIGADYGVSGSNICDIKKRKTYKNIV